MPATASLFKKYQNPIFIETGSETGEGIQRAIEAGFNKIFSIEFSEQNYLWCRNRFRQNPGVHLIHGDSGIVLDTVLKIIDQPVTFWLDGHNEDEYPVLQELQAIKMHSVKTHTILIDDLRMFDLAKHGLSLEIIKAKIREINPDYRFILENGHCVNDILAATVEI
jgi:hypothetical protein